MERRLNSRYRGAGSVYVSAGNYRHKRMPISNLSARGVFLESQSFTLPLDTRVQLVFVVESGTVTRLYHRHAIVAHTSRHGIGMLLHRDATAPRTHDFSVSR